MQGYEPALQALCYSVRLVRLVTEHRITQSATEHYSHLPLYSIYAYPTLHRTLVVNLIY